MPDSIAPTAPGTHDDTPLAAVPHRVVATWPVGTFVENVVALPDGDLVVSVHSARELHRVTRDGARTVLASLPLPPTGLVLVDDGFFVVAGEPGVAPGVVLHVGRDGVVSEWLRLDDALFLNGFTPGRAGRAYTVDSLRGTVIEVDLVAATARVVLAHSLLSKCSADPMMPGVNGIKADDDALWLTNTDRALVLRAPLGAGGPTGEVEVVAERLRGDDIALGAAGELYVTTHIHNTLVRLGRDGRRIALAGPAQGMPGATACAFGTAPGDETALYVTATGGVIRPYEGVVREAKLVRLDVGARGRPVAFLG